MHVDAAGVHLGDPPFAEVAHQPLGAATDLAGLFLEIAARTVEKARRGEMLCSAAECEPRAGISRDGPDA